MLSLREFLSQHSDVVLIRLEEVKGSSPREAGTFMLVAKKDLWGTIGGGQFEYLAIDEARVMLRLVEQSKTLDIPLGPDIGQCCGGRCLISLTYVTDAVHNQLLRKADAVRAAEPNIFIFGSGHVGKALANAFHLLPVQVTVVESRASELIGLDEAATRRLTAIPEAVAREMPLGSAAIITTHDHAQDFLIGEACLKRQDLAYIGMIGSATKRASFKSHLKLSDDVSVETMDQLAMPIGGKSLSDKRPEMIAAMVVAEVLVAIEQFQKSHIKTAEEQAMSA